MTRRGSLALLVASVVTTTLAWNPYLYRHDAPLRWDLASPVAWSHDNGRLGLWANVTAVAELQAVFDQWAAVPTSTMAYAAQGPILHPVSGTPIDVTSATFSIVVNADDGTNPVIFDNNMDILGSLGLPSSVAGFASINKFTGTTADKSYAVINGDFFNGNPNDGGEFTEDEFRHVLLHEVGHMTGLGHSSVNHEFLTGVGGCPPPASATQIEQMTPFTESGMTAFLHHDDRMGLSHLYPSPTFDSDNARIRGEILSRDSVVFRDGANIVLRPITADCNALYDLSQSNQAGANPGEFGYGGYEFPGLSPGSDHSLFAHQITDGGVYPLGAATLGGPDDYYNGVNEAHFDPPDVPTEIGAATAGAAGTLTAGFDILINNAVGPTALTPSGADALAAERLDGNTALPSELLIVEEEYGEGVVEVAPPTTRLAWVNWYTPSANRFPMTIERIEAYVISLVPIAGRSIRMLVYHDPGATGDIANASLIYSETTTIPAPGGGVNGYDFYPLTSPVTVTEGEIYVGFFDMVSDANDAFAAYDPVVRGASFVAFDSTNPADFVPVVEGNFYIRTRISVTPEAQSVWLNWGDSCNEATVEDQDFVVYQGNLASLGGSPDHLPVTCSTDDLKRWVILPEPGDLFWLVTPRVSTHEGDLGTGTGGTPRPPTSTCATVSPETCP